MPAPVLLTVSGTIPIGNNDAIARGERPRADYYELAAGLDADVIDYAEARRTHGRAGRLIGRLMGDDAVLAWACFRRRRQHRVVFTDSERVGMLFAALCRLRPRRTRHIMIGHRLSPPKKVLLHRALGLGRRIDHVVVYAAEQRDVAIERLGFRADQVTLTPFMVDTTFWRSDDLTVPVQARPMVCSAGLELRDYPTFVDAVRGLDVDVVVAAASPWSKRSDQAPGIDVPANVRVTRLNFFELRQLYAEAGFLVMPLEETDFQAGITTILEAMSMGLAVVCSRTAGQTDTIVDGENGLYVPPGDAPALRTAIQRLLADPDEAARLGAAGQRWVREQGDIEVYVRRLAELTRAVGAR